MRVNAADSADLTGNGHGDVLVDLGRYEETYGFTSQVTALDGATGQLL
jgi:hypothetical protein